MVDPVQNLGESFICNIEKVFLCTGADGYVPKYDPTNREYGCLADAPSLLYRFKVLDKAQPETQARLFGNVLFDAKLAIDSPDALPLVKQPGSDGFSVSSAPLFQVAAGREWYIHMIYTVRSRENANKGIGKRSLGYHHGVSAAGIGSSAVAPYGGRSRRAALDLEVAQDIGLENNRGTNIQHIALDRANKLIVSQRDFRPNEELYQRPLLESSGKESSELVIMPMAGGVAGLLLLICAVIIIILLLRRRGHYSSDEKKSPSSSSSGYHGRSSRETMSTWHSSDSSEV
ncbi:UNVERIFIED_CONTAM: hypothetical protein FKN15_022780 [Acipenser sinensis]